MVSNEQKVKAYVAVTEAIAAAIRQLGSVPEGHLYASVMKHLTLPQFTAMIDCLVEVGDVERTRAHELRWVGR